ncbi:MAG TPA: signal recognition particle protein [Candidatus Kapabacteria bacterium]|nr:signal recognition particle protein [Candidatus Kapabacteria bacterium]
MFEDLSAKLESVFKRIRGEARITEDNVADALRDVRRALLDADVNLNVARDFIQRVQKISIGMDVLRSIAPAQQIVKIINDELIALMGGSAAELHFASTPPTVIMIAGLQGSGKTTFSAKLARYLKSKGKNPELIAADIYRPAAVEQLKTLGKQIEVPVFNREGASALENAVEGIKDARQNAKDVVIIDTAGRLAIDEQMMQEVATIKERVSPTEILFVVDSMTGQDAVNTAKAFHDRLDFDGVVLTKLDGDTRGGAALSIRSVVEKPIKFVSTGEKLDALEPFYPDRMASRILGMGDVVTLVEKAQEQYDEEAAEKLEKKLRKNQFTLDDFLDQLQQIKKMGSLGDLLSMIPGVGSAARNLKVDDKAFVRIECIIQSMTKEERANPRIINGSRRKRIAAGSGTTIQDVNKMLKQFEDMQRMMKNMSSGKMRQLAQQFKMTGKMN